MKIKVKLSKKLEKCLDHLENISNKSKEFIIQEALIQYIEDMKDIQELAVLEALQIGKKEKTYTSKELSKKLGI